MNETEGHLVIRDRTALAQACAEWIVETAARAIAGRGRCLIALAGGATPQPVYQALAAPPLAAVVDWTRFHVYFGDERAVPPDDPESNYRMARETLLSRVPIPPGQVHRMEAERADLDAAAADYDRLLPRPLDVLLLGIGPDGHTASIFPGSPALREHGRHVVPVVGPPPPPRRLTITPPVFHGARAIAVIATGAEKAAMVATVLGARADVGAVPAMLARRGIWFLDSAAASRLPGRA